MIKISQPTVLGNEHKYVNDVLFNNHLSMGEYVRRFELELALRHSARFAIATSSGTAALHIALLACGLKSGERVLVPACSYIATANAVRYCGAEPVFVDVDPQTWMMETTACADVDDAVGSLPVYLYGGLHQNARRGGNWVVADACEAHGQPLHRKVNASVLSFYGNKIITCGEGGAVLTNSEELADRCRQLRGQGTTGAYRYIHEIVGFNYRMTDLQAAFGLGQVEKLDEHLVKRAYLEDMYRNFLRGAEIRTQTRPEGSSAWVFPVCVEDRNIVMRALEERGIETRPVFSPLHMQPPYVGMGNPSGWMPVAEELGRTGLLLPLHLGMTDKDVKYICAELRKAIGR